MSQVLLEAISAIGRVIRSIRTALADSQQHLIPALLAVLVTGVSVSAQPPATIASYTSTIVLKVAAWI